MPWTFVRPNPWASPICSLDICFVRICGHEGGQGDWAGKYPNCGTASSTCSAGSAPAGRIGSAGRGVYDEHVRLRRVRIVVARPRATVLSLVPARMAQVELVDVIAMAADLQSTDPGAQEQAMAALDCSIPDTLQRNEIQELPLVTCNIEGTEVYQLAPTIIDGASRSRTRAPTSTRIAAI